MLIGGKAQLLAICVARNEMLLAARAEFSKNGLLTRAPAAKLTEEGDAFHFVAAVPISVLVELCKRATKKNKNVMRKMIQKSGVDLDDMPDIWLNWGAFPGGKPEVRRLRCGQLVGLEGLATLSGGDKLHVIIGGF